jgi:hypothetical protein
MLRARIIWRLRIMSRPWRAMLRIVPPIIELRRRARCAGCVEAAVRFAREF